MKALLALATLLLVTGCTSGGESDGSADGPAPGAQSPPTLAPPSAPSEQGEPGGPGVADSDACAEVVAGINAFNRGDYDETVSRFEAAVPLAKDQDDGSADAADLVEAVEYYAELAPDDYLEASQTSADFQKYKAITLTQCASDGGLEVPGGSGSEPSGVPA